MTKKRSDKTPAETPEPDAAKSPDRRRLEAMAADIFARRFRSPLDEAQEIMCDAWEAETRKQAITLARKALKVSPDCADGSKPVWQATPGALDWLCAGIT